MTGRSDEDLDLLVGVDGAVTMRVTEFHGVHGRRVVRGVDVLVQVRVGLRCGDLGVHVVVRLGALDLDDAAAPVDPGVGLVGLPAELGGVEPVEVDPVLGRLALAVEGAADLHVAVRRVDVGEVVLLAHPGLADDVPPIMIEVAVDELLRQAVGGVFHHIVVRRESHSAGGLVLGGLGGVLPTALVRRDLAGGIRRVLVIGQLVGTGEFDIVKVIAGIPFRGRDGFEGETHCGDLVGHEIRAGVCIPLLVVRAVGRGRGRDGGHPLADLVAVFGRDSGGFLRGLLVWFADQDLHLVHVGAGRAGMLQTPFHHGARRDLHILIDRGALLVGGQFGELVVVDGIVIEFHIASLAAHAAGMMRVSLGGVPSEIQPVPIGNGPACGGHGASRTVFAGTGIDGGEQLALVVFVRTRLPQRRP